MIKDQKNKDEITKPIPNENAWGLADHEMPAAPSDAEQQKIDEAIGQVGVTAPTERVPDISKGTDINYG